MTNTIRTVQFAEFEINKILVPGEHSGFPLERFELWGFAMVGNRGVLIHVYKTMKEAKECALSWEKRTKELLT